MNKGSLQTLRRLALRCGIQTSYRDNMRRRRTASAETLLAVLRAYGIPLASPDEARDALRALAEWERPLPPVCVARPGRPARLPLRLPERLAKRTIRFTLAPEEGPARRWTRRAADLRTLRVHRGEAGAARETEVLLPAVLPFGYHRLAVELDGAPSETLLLCAPQKAYEPEDLPSKAWGLFIPTYALRSAASWGAGNLTDLQAVGEWVAGLGGSFVATLPLLPCFLRDPFDPSPYAPVSRTFWNEFTIDIPRVPEFETCRAARALASSRSFSADLRAVRAQSRVDYRREMALRRAVLERMAAHFFSKPSARLREFRRFCSSRPRVEDYASFRAATEKHGRPWPQWPAPARKGRLTPRDYDPHAKRYHMYAQWIADRQMRAAAEKARASRSGFYLDLPVGAHAHGYDTWRERASFAEGAAAGSPPDDFFAGGQSWGFPPLHPRRAREQGYRHLVDVLRHHMSRATILRIDHVMGFHRLFWVPEGTDARDGAYVRYNAEEIYALLSIESHRNRTMLIGEDLGTVPAYVRRAMARRNLRRMFVAQFKLQDDPARAVPPVTAKFIAGFGTHDTATFAGFWRGLDLRRRKAAGWIDAAEFADSTRKRGKIRNALVSFLQGKGLLGARPREADILRALLLHMAAGPASILLIALEDLWLETRQQNAPGSPSGAGNWTAKAGRTVEQFTRSRAVNDFLRHVDQTRGRKT